MLVSNINNARGSPASADLGWATSSAYHLRRGLSHLPNVTGNMNVSFEHCIYFHGGAAARKTPVAANWSEIFFK
jgi:hypothetical protein